MAIELPVPERLIAAVGAISGQFPVKLPVLPKRGMWPIGVN
jgi:hypothetical protein